ncbi:glycosyltransferase family 39 protein, partial [Neisseria gonorrhoeae]
MCKDCPVQSFLLPVFLCLMPSEAVSARPLCEYLLHLAIRPFLLTLMLTYTPPPGPPPPQNPQK